MRLSRRLRDYTERMLNLGLFYHYDEAGPGVSKNGPKKNRLRVFFEIFGRKFWKLCLLNLIYLLFCIPVVTIGPATSALMRVLKNYSIEKNSFVWSDFVESFKKDFGKSFIIGLLYAVIFTGITTGMFIYPDLIATSNLYLILMVITAIIGFVAVVSFFFAFLMTSTIDLTVKDILKNSLILTVVMGWRGLLTALLVAIIIGGPLALGAFVFPPIWLLTLGLSFSLAGLVAAYNCYPYVQKYVVEPYYKAIGKDNPEYDYLKPAGMEDINVFEDKGGEEAPIVKTKSTKTGKKNKTIS